MKKDSYRIDFPTEIVKEGRVKILVPKLKAFIKKPSDYAPSKAPVFYNPVMELNRDLAVLALRAYQRIVNHEMSVCEPLAGCGVRGVRFAKEVEGVQRVVVNDINERSFQIAKRNAKMNWVNKRVTVENKDANFLLAYYGAPRKRFDVIDIDPFGSPVPYIDSALRALRDKGLLALTATDMAPLCGVHSKACLRRYGGKPLRTEYCHELAARLLTGCLASTAAKHDIGINVVFSHSTDHYVRVYATIKYSAKKADESIKKMGYIAHCFKCFHRETTKGLFSTGGSGKCNECRSKTDVAGPLWLGKISDKLFCELIEEEAKHVVFKQGDKIRRLLSLIENEVEAPITYYVIDKLCGRLNLPVPSVKRVVEALKDEGYQAFLTHFNPKGVKSDAPMTKIEEILREYRLQTEKS